MKKILFYALTISAVLFSGCSDDDDDNNTGNNGNNNNGLDKNGELVLKASEISGLPSSVEIAEVHLRVWDFSENDGGMKTVKQVKWDNGFTLEFPETIAPKYLQNIAKDLEDEDDEREFQDYEEYEYKIVISNKNANYSDYDTELALYDAEGEWVGRIYLGTSKSESCYTYADADCKISGYSQYTDKEEEPYYTWKVTYDMDLKKGWNMVFVTDNSSDNNDETDFSTKTPSGAGWKYSDDTLYW